jgi:hypothetical protein
MSTKSMRNRLLDHRPTSPEELLLIRAGRHLWRSRKRKEWPEAPLFLALQAIWDAKKALRVELRRSWLETLKNRTKHLPARFRPETHSQLIHSAA